jgi:MFS family permease
VHTLRIEKRKHVEHSEKPVVPLGDGKLEYGQQLPVSQYELTPADDELNYFGKCYLLLYACCFLIYFNSTMKDYDGVMMASLDVLPEYQAYFHLGGAASATFVVFAIFQVGQIAASFFFWPMDIFGRKTILFACSRGVIVSVIIQETAKNISVFIGGRFVGAFFSTIFSVTSVVYLVEVAPPLHRGTVAGMFNTLYYCGALIASFSSYGASIHHSGSQVAWKTPVYLRLMCPFIVAAFIFLVPESPRWLIMKSGGRKPRTSYLNTTPTAIFRIPRWSLSFGR